MKISPKLSEKIEAVLQEYISNPEPEWVYSDKTVNLRTIAAELKVLPLVLDWSGAFGICPNGDFFSFSYEKPYEIRTNYNQREINGILFQGVKNFPELQELMPNRPDDAQVCESCNGTGREPINDVLGYKEERFVCLCGGLGWLPKNED